MYPSMPTTMPDVNLKVYGSFVSYYVIYQEGEHIVNKVIQKAGSNVSLIDKYEEDGYSFTPWETTDVTVSDNQFTMPRSDVVFKTTRSINSYTITYMLDNNKYYSETKKYLENCPLYSDPNPLKGHTFSGWQCNDVEIINGKFIMTNKDIVFKGTYQKNNYLVIYKLNGEKLYQDTYTYQDIVTIRDDEVKKGFIFSGWIIPSDIIVNDNKFTMGDKDIIIEGNMTKGQFNIYIYVDDSTEIIKSLKADYLENVTLSLELTTYLEVDYWESDDVVIQDNNFIMPSNDVSINCVTKYRSFKVKYLESSTGNLVKEESVQYLNTANVDTSSCIRRGKELISWQYYSGLSTPLTNNSFTMPANDVIFVGEWTPCFTIDDGINYDKYDTENSLVSGYSYNCYDRVLEINDRNLTLSGNIENVLIFINTDNITLSNLTISSNEEGYYYTYYRNDIEFYYRSEIDACILINTIEERTININIDGIVEINKQENNEYEFVSSISTINNQRNQYLELVNLEYGEICFNGIGREKSILRIKDSNYGIFSYLSVSINDLTLDINSKNSGLIGGEINLSNCDINISSDEGEAISAQSESSVNQYDLNINDCTLDITGAIYCSNTYEFTGKTSGIVKSSYPCIRSNGNIKFSLDDNYQIKFKKTTSTEDLQSVIEKIYYSQIIFENNNGFISEKSLSFEQSKKQFYNEFDCLGYKDNELFILVDEVIIGHLPE